MTATTVDTFSQEEMALLAAQDPRWVDLTRGRLERLRQAREQAHEAEQQRLAQEATRLGPRPPVNECSAAMAWARSGEADPAAIAQFPSVVVRYLRLHGKRVEAFGDLAEALLDDALRTGPVEQAKTRRVKAQPGMTRSGRPRKKITDPDMLERRREAMAKARAARSAKAAERRSGDQTSVEGDQ